MKIVLSILMLIFLGLQYQLWFGQGGLVAIWHINSKMAAQRQINQQLNERNQILLADIEDLRHGDEAIEERARQELGMIKPNETFYRIVVASS